MSTLVKISDIKNSPFRNTSVYPYREEKIEFLMSSIADTGFWDGVYARPTGRGNKVELSFGHHRIEAARRLDLKEVNISVEEMTDERMIKKMGRENREEYGNSFLSFLEAWEAASGFMKATGGRLDLETVDIARFLGWIDSDDKSDHTARACANATTVIEEHSFNRDDLEDMPVRQVRDVCSAVLTNIKRVKKAAVTTEEPARETTKRIKRVVKAVKDTVKEVKAGKVAPSNISSTVTAKIVAADPTEPVVMDLGSVVDKTCDYIRKMFEDDPASKLFKELAFLNGEGVLYEDPDSELAMRRIFLALEELEDRISDWREKLSSDNLVLPTKSPNLQLV